MPTYRATIGGSVYEVQIEDPFATPVVAIVDGERYTVEVEELWAAVEQEAPVVESRPVAPPRPTVAAVQMVAAPAPLPTATVPTIAPAAAPPASGETIAAPMPGKVLAVKVAVGDAVSKGDEVCTLEAMKMAMAVRSTADGTVREVRVVTGQAVNHGETLLVVG